MKYVLITAARNEEGFLGNTIRSVIIQSVRPLKWVIVNDGSTDRTDDIITSYARRYDWIEILRMPEHRDRHFGAKAQCFNAGYASLSDLEFDLVGNLDADITFESDYYQFLLARFEERPDLGVAGTPFTEDFTHPGNHAYARRSANLEHVSGACQMFRRACFEAVGGYVPIKGGGIDWLAVTSARMRGWKTRTFTEKLCYHHRPMGTGGRNLLGARFAHGQEDYYVGNHPLWQLGRGVFQMGKKPYLLGGLAILAGYGWAALKKVPSPVPADLRAFYRKEQLSRLRKLVLR